jgi:hypothetical protein
VGARKLTAKSGKNEQKSEVRKIIEIRENKPEIFTQEKVR